LNGLAVAEADARDHLGEPFGAVQPTPVALGGLGVSMLDAGSPKRLDEKSAAGSAV
jgi:hypothetical protein